MSKVLSVTFSDGSTWHIPAEVVAQDRAEYYAAKTLTPEEYNLIINEEFNYTLSDKMELIEWAVGNMEWEDLKDHAVFVDRYVEEPDYDKEWSNRVLSVREV